MRVSGTIHTCRHGRASCTWNITVALTPRRRGTNRPIGAPNCFYRDVELLNSWASLYGMPSRQERLNDGWRLILLNQFHDVLPGSSIHEVYEDTERLYAEVRAIGEEIRDEALAVLRRVLHVGSKQLLLLNTLPWERTDPLQLPIAMMRLWRAIHKLCSG